MTEATFILDPTAEHTAVIRPRIDRVASLDGLRIGLLDIAKARGDVFMDRLDENLTERGFSVNRYRKKRFSVLAPDELQQKIHAECDVVIEALAD